MLPDERDSNAPQSSLQPITAPLALQDTLEPALRAHALPKPPKRDGRLRSQRGSWHQLWPARKGRA